jgi:hypothetical protein
MGFKALLYSSHNFYEVLYECRNDCLSRMEFSETLESVQQEIDFFNEDFVD